MKKPLYLNDGTNELFEMEDSSSLNQVYVSIPVYFDVDRDGCVYIDTDRMDEEFQRHVYGLETIVEDYNQDLN